MNYRLKGAVALAFATTFATGAFAQEVPEAELKAALEKYDGSEVLATVGDQKVTLSDAAMIYTTLPAEVGRVPAEQLMSGITDQLISETALYEKALEEGLDDSKEMKNRLAAIRRSALAEAYLTKQLEERITEESLREQYDAMTKDFEGEKEVNARHILVKTEAEAKELVEELKDGGDFAKLLCVDPLGHISRQEVWDDGGETQQGRSSDEKREIARKRHQCDGQELPPDKHRGQGPIGVAISER